ncbi:hypothetical protein DVDV_4150 [Desulfovibrio sp. DV]|uniref:hypothetical protein n=1 Tax=Desulfovibrio sp. DV TaxID=1844708 RepID=UPI000962CAB9|nr:hypothetical protein [Desulfovibrio sp. DV]OLN24529.1 hypothetical protein DVDV_4150 [Desulfovibrio sp. DV]
MKLKVLFGKISKLKDYVKPELDLKVFYNSQLECLEVEARELQFYVTVLEYYRRRLVLFSYFRKRKKCFALRLSHKGDVLVESEDIYVVFKILVRLLLSHFPPDVLLREEHLPAGAQCHPEGP